MCVLPSESTLGFYLQLWTKMFTETSTDASELVGSVETAARATDVLVGFEDSELSAPLVGPGADSDEILDAGVMLLISPWLAFVLLRHCCRQWRLVLPAIISPPCYFDWHQVTNLRPLVVFRAALCQCLRSDTPATSGLCPSGVQEHG
jgi:hypothetical protein